MLYSYFVLVLLPLTLPFIEAQNGGFSVELIHRDSPKSPFYNPTETSFHKLKNALHRSLNRYKHFYPQANVSRNTPVTIISPIEQEFVMKYSIGTPPFNVMGLVDTASDITWLQCLPCEKCYNQTDPLFNPSKSSTYQLAPCNSQECHSIHFSFCNNGSNCLYNESYYDGSYTAGNVAFDTLTLPSTTGSSVAFPNITIACGLNNSGIYDPKASGIVGLGAGKISLISQIGPSIGSKFSYCLLPTSNSSSKLNFGENAIVAGPGVVSTPILSGPDTFYYLTLEAMSVGPKRIELVGSSKAQKGNIIIDSGTTLTLLPQDLYTKLESEVVAHIKLKRDPGRDHISSLCYKASLDEIGPPNITAHFTGADVVLNSVNTFISDSNNFTCFAFFPVPDDAIYGNVAQINFLIGYDLQQKTLSFKSTDCTKM
ncbi:hypothetical protein VNO77_27453 [Canavalia gladiata]|uniref:Peptidase A1 domain-containing protein n=1 Tax=Canavalia gladiata TaxID=3824 RepID=A0AAN9KU57_CANGL